ncbi:MAG: hypothetical protein FWE96_08525 [Coriobacteriia bacterium]|nr:hypothetical protein [Coriobacteriia bacterium]
MKKFMALVKARPVVSAAIACAIVLAFVGTVFAFMNNSDTVEESPEISSLETTVTAEEMSEETTEPAEAVVEPEPVVNDEADVPAELTLAQHLVGVFEYRRNFYGVAWDADHPGPVLTLNEDGTYSWIIPGENGAFWGGVDPWQHGGTYEITDFEDGHMVSRVFNLVDENSVQEIIELWDSDSDRMPERMVVLDLFTTWNKPGAEINNTSKHWALIAANPDLDWGFDGEPWILIEEPEGPVSSSVAILEKIQ